MHQFIMHNAVPGQIASLLQGPLTYLEIKLMCSLLIHCLVCGQPKISPEPGDISFLVA